MDAPVTTSSGTVVQRPPNSTAAILTFEDMEVLGVMLGKNLQNREQLINAVSAATAFSVEDVLVRLEPRLLTRLKSRCLDKPNWASWLAEVVKKQLHDYAGY